MARPLNQSKSATLGDVDTLLRISRRIEESSMPQKEKTKMVEQLTAVVTALLNEGKRTRQRKTSRAA